MRQMIAILSVLLAIASPATAGEWISWAAPAAPDVRQVKCMAEAIYFEAGNEPMAGRIAVAKVVLNRMNSGIYPQNACGVVYQRNHQQAGCQFTWACRKNNRIVSQALYDEALVIAESVMMGFHADASNGALSFNNRPCKDKRLVKTAQIGGHYFYKRI
jgi:spore germination cell wall hydrolase CwlJ-like protein